MTNWLLRRRGGFSLVELLVVIGIVVLLVAILVPVVGRVRAASRSTKCLANLQQWGYAYQAYLSANHNTPIAEVEGADHLRWWEVVGSHTSDVRKSLLCPDAIEPRTEARIPDGIKSMVAVGAAHNAWRTANKWSPARDYGQDYFGSYAINVWTNHHRFPNMKNLYISFPVRHADRVPLLGDSVGPWAAPTSGDRPPADLNSPETGNAGIPGYCIDRHQFAVNIVFLDGHGEHVALPNLWQLQWSESSKPVWVTVPGR